MRNQTMKPKMQPRVMVMMGCAGCPQIWRDRASCQGKTGVELAAKERRDRKEEREDRKAKGLALRSPVAHGVFFDLEFEGTEIDEQAMLGSAGLQISQ